MNDVLMVKVEEEAAAVQALRPQWSPHRYCHATAAL